MLRYNGYFVFFMLTIFGTSIEGQANLVVNTDVQANYSTALTTCGSLAEPHLYYDGQSKSYATQAKIISAESGSDFVGDAWIGYKRVYKIFKYIGCSPTPAGNVVVFENNRSISDCYSKCSVTSTVIGLTMDKCYCFPAVPTGQRFSLACEATCNDPPGTECGGITTTSLYQIVSDTVYNNVTRGSQQGDCISLMFRSTNLTWTPCEMSIFVHCQDLSFSSVIAATTWKGAIKNCISNQRLPLDENTYGIINGSNLPARWTGMFRAHVIMSRGNTDSAASLGSEEDILYVTRSDEKKRFDINFTKTTLSGPKHYICARPGEFSTTSTTNTTTITTTLTATMTKLNPTTAEARVEMDAKERNDHTGVYVGIGIGLAVAIVVVIVVVLWCQRKKRTNPTNQAISMITHRQEPQTSSKPPAHISVDYTEVDLDLPENSHTFVVANGDSQLETFQYATVHKAGRDIPKTVNDGVDNTYDVTNPNMRQENEVPNNVYDHLADKNKENMYDKAETSSNSRAKAGEINEGFEYSTSRDVKTAAELNDTPYDTTTHESSSSKKIPGNDSTIYDTAAYAKASSNVTDDTYEHVQQKGQGKERNDGFFI